MTDLFRERCRALGSGVLDFVHALQRGEKKPDEFPDPAHPYFLRFGSCWNATLVYGVPDFVAELGFWSELMGFSCNALMDDYAMFTPPGREFFFSVVPASEAHPAVQGLQIEFMVEDLDETLEQCRLRELPIVREPWRPFGEENPMRCALLCTPNDVRVQLWCFPRH